MIVSMKSAFSVAFLCILFATVLQAQGQPQAGCEIQVTLNNYPHDTIWLGHLVGKRAEPEIFALKQADGNFLLKSDAALPAGMYALIMRRQAMAPYQYVSCWLLDRQRRFNVTADFNQLFKTITFTGAAVENDLLYNYVRKYKEFTDRLDDANDNYKDMPGAATFEAKVIAEKALEQYQSDFSRQHHGTKTSELIQQTLFLVPPTAEEHYDNWQQEANARFQWQKQHFFDRMDLTSPELLRQPLWLERVDFYATKLPPPHPDSMKMTLENIFRKLEPNKEAYQYYFRYMMNSLTRMSRYRTDEVFVYLVRKYVDSGKVAWLPAEDLDKYRTEASRMEPLFVGKKAPDITVYDKENKEVSLYGIKSPYTLLVFWRHDCSHCRKELPLLKKVYEQYAAKGVKVLTVCGNSGDGALSGCWSFAESMPMPAEWLMLADPDKRSRFSSLFNVSGYPRMYLMDANKKILYKHSGEASEAALNFTFETYIK